MGLLQRLAHSNFFIKLRSWEYWPFGIAQFPAIVYYIWLSFRARSFIFFSASNPGIPMGGMFGESKFELLEKIPSQYVPRTILINSTATVEEVLKRLTEENFRFPMIFKPDLGERGFMVKRIYKESDIDAYLRKVKINFIAQELVDLPVELGVFYTRFPDREKGDVTSVTMKEMLCVHGDGASTLRELIFRKDRAKLQWPILKATHGERLQTVIPEGELVELVSIGNHCLGTKFVDANYLINQRLSETFDNISKQIEGFYFGRFDLRCANLEDLYDGKIKIMELNGCGAEPAHVYNPGYSLRKAMREFCLHWRNIFLISRENKKRGVSYTSMKDAFKHYKTFKAAFR